MIRLVALIGFFTSFICQAEELAVCGNPSGYTYYNFQAPVPKSKSGFQQDAITKGKTILVKNSDGTYDIVITDAYEVPFSSAHDGAQISVIRSGRKNAAVLSYYNATQTIEIYNFFIEDDGTLKFSMYTNKGGPLVTLGKSTLFVGNCSKLDIRSIQ